MVIISPVDDLACHPHAGNATGGRSSHPPASNPAASFFDDHGTAAGYVPDITAGSSHPPLPYAPPPATTGGAFSFNPSSSPPMFPGYTMDAFFTPPPAMAEPSHYWYPPCVAPAPFAQAQDAMPPPVLVPMQTMRAEPFFHTQTQRHVAAAAAEDMVVHALADTKKAQETATPTPRRRGRPRKNVALAAVATKPGTKPKPKRATVRSNRAALEQAASATAISGGQVQVPLPVPYQVTNGGVEVQVQQPDQAAPTQVDPCTNPMALVCQEQWPLQPTFSNSLNAVIGQEVMLHYADTSAEGVRFQPTDEELIFYLRLKHAGMEMPVDFFKEFDVYGAYPEKSRDVCGVVNGFWYAFSPRDRKYKNGARPARSVVDSDGRQLGYWKSNTKLAPVRRRADGVQIGTVESLTFHLGRQPHGAQTPWKMKEYAIPENQHAPDGSAMRLNDWVVCKLFYRERAVAAGQEEGQLGEAAENDSRAGGDEGMQMVPSDDQTPRDSEQQLRVEDYLVDFEASVQQNQTAN
ncbi:hypothetical protein HU200_013012 [Digitaria exilis]|uniref:NAC domain-containing protein n=1 Tax=Digitaria exilis TaxID=1010633 RepID=A0A835FEG8_9POAL|nr:hypothetical protein HU200_013012 [Digitaria exilis]